MPITTPVHITIVLDPASRNLSGHENAIEDPTASESPLEWLMDYMATRIIEVPSEHERAFVLSAYTGKGTPWQMSLSPAQSQTLVALLAQLPTASMTAPMMSFDGIAYKLQVVQEGPPCVFAWSNEDWRYANTIPKEGWEQVSALVEYVRGLEKELRLQ